MSWLSNLSKLFGFSRRDVSQRERSPSRQIRGRYDAAETTDENSRHWAMVDGLSARSANSPIVRKRLRDRMRYETANNPMAEGMVSSFANDVIGTGPRLQLLTKDDAINERITLAWRRWSKLIRLRSKLSLLVRAKLNDGEAFAQFTTNERLSGSVKLDFKPFEAEMCASPTENLADPFRVDGIDFDAAGNPERYHILKQHPGDLGPNFWETYALDAAYVVHWFKISRPGQVRGIPENHSSLSLFAARRRFMLATLMAAESAANFGGVIETEAPPGEADSTDPLSTVDLDRNTVMTLPYGNKFHQIASEHPNDTFPAFNREITKETGRPIGQPYNVTAGDSSEHNYASGRLDHQGYWNVIDITREDCEDVVIDRVFQSWFAEYRLTDEFAGMDAGDDVLQEITSGDAVEWEWDGHPHIDSNKEANAQETRLSNGVISFDTEMAADGYNRKREWSKQAKALGLTDRQFAEAMRRKFFGFDPLNPEGTAVSGQRTASRKPVEPDEPSRAPRTAIPVRQRQPMPAGGRV
jgi:lambda family phage portal protein